MSEDAPQSSSTPVQERTAAESVIVDVEVHKVPDSEPEEGAVGGDSSMILTHVVTGGSIPTANAGCNGESRASPDP